MSRCGTFGSIAATPRRSIQSPRGIRFRVHVFSLVRGFARNPGCLTPRERVGSVRVCLPYHSPSIFVYASTAIVSAFRFPLFGNPPRAFHSRGLFIRDVGNVQTTELGKCSLPRKEYRGKYEEQTELAPHTGPKIEKNFHRSNRALLSIQSWRVRRAAAFVISLQTDGI